MKARTILASAIALAFVSTCSLAHAKPMNCAVVTTKQIEGLFDRWNTSLATLDPVKVTANYASDAVLLPTVSNTPRTDSASIRDYFVDFLQKHPQGKIDTRTVKIGCNMASDVGTYTFTLSGKTPGETQIVKARYSYVYVYRDKKWLIAHHHSSAMPEPTTPATAAAAPK
jgi:uncharacterized protein (TIGR02246 family)